jgi:hypothetical protein
MGLVSQPWQTVVVVGGKSTSETSTHDDINAFIHDDILTKPKSAMVFVFVHI